MNYQLKIIGTKIRKDRISERQNNKKRKDRKTKRQKSNEVINRTQKACGGEEEWRKKMKRIF